MYTGQSSHLVFHWRECSGNILRRGTGSQCFISIYRPITSMMAIYCVFYCNHICKYISFSVQLSVPSSPHTLPDQLAMLSTEHLSLGSLPLFSPVRRLVFLSNLHPSHPISFHWSLSSTGSAAEVRFTRHVHVFFILSLNSPVYQVV